MKEHDMYERRKQLERESVEKILSSDLLLVAQTLDIKDFQTLQSALISLQTKKGWGTYQGVNIDSLSVLAGYANQENINALTNIWQCREVDELVRIKNKKEVEAAWGVVFDSNGLKRKDFLGAPPSDGSLEKPVKMSQEDSIAA